MIDEWILEAARSTGEVAERISVVEVSQLISEIRRKFTAPEINSAFLWEQFENEVSRRNERGWQLLCEYLVSEPILLSEEGESFVGFRFHSQSSLSRVIAESPGFEFYLTDAKATFVICHNHHDCLIGVGACAEWLSQLPEDVRD